MFEFILNIFAYKNSLFVNFAFETFIHAAMLRVLAQPHDLTAIVADLNL